MDFVSHFHREAQAFETAARRAVEGAAPLVPYCPGWTVSDLVVHLATVHRYVARVIRDRLSEQLDPTDLTFLGLPADHRGWPRPETAPNHGPAPARLIDWYAEGAAELETLFRDRAPDERVWTWSSERTVAFWLRIQCVEAAVHRWDAESAFGPARPVDTEPAADAVGHTFQVMAPARRGQAAGPARSGRAVRVPADRRRGQLDGVLRRPGGPGHRRRAGTGPCDVELAGTASDLMLFLWQRIPADHIEVKGDSAMLDRYFALMPPV
ncbi:maleylpyruvate isomerase family mycothiol-dependent enzyme [Streptomyces sp. A5-4]|uniref:maleylpyruvate isomerase family mycothiol-dependent enzyme n=1 Tax=Streptomyces sp. A5-4 TaxID=3384771 RepID=UPI003DA84DF2